MKRKTNLFYLSGDDSKFITFSNYGESMTGNYLATDWKLFPSHFICMYIQYLDKSDIKTYLTTKSLDNSDEAVNKEFEKRKANFITYLVQSYENKLAFLRDYCLDKNLNTEKLLKPLNYLLESIYLSNANKYSDNYELTMLDYKAESCTNKNSCYISFIGDITEQDYNGIYSDSIFVINSCDSKCGNVIINSQTPDTVHYGEIVKHNHLYGWTEYNDENAEFIGMSQYTEVEPIFNLEDETGKYYYTSSCISGLDLNNDFDEYGNQQNIKFNIIIPLYDLINISTNSDLIINKNDNYTDNVTNSSSSDIDNIDSDSKISLTNNSDTYVKNVPLGVWFSEEVIELKRNKETGYAPSWSLLLSSQFKPFPYAQKIPNEIKQDATKEAFATYSQVLIRQNRLMELMENLSNEIKTLNNRVYELEGKLNTVGCAYTMDGVRKEMLNFEEYQKQQMSKFQSEIYAYITNNWKGYIS